VWDHLFHHVAAHVEFERKVRKQFITFEFQALIANTRRAFNLAFDSVRVQRLTMNVTRGLELSCTRISRSILQRRTLKSKGKLEGGS
jgi:hypothetical protein